MVKFWAKTELDERLTRSIIVEFESFKQKDFDECLVKICYELDVPTPVVLKSHLRNLVNFNVTRFARTDFIDVVDFDLLIIEYVAD